MRPGLRLFLLLLACLAALQARAQNYSDIWWNPNESGWGLTIADHETQLFVVWYTYRADGKPVWYVIPGGVLSNSRRNFQGDIYVTTGPSHTAATFDPSQVGVTKVGTMSLDFAPAGQPAGSARVTYSLLGVTQSKIIQRQPFGSAAPAWGSDFTDIYYNPDESGWGLTLAQHGNNVFGVWYTYDTNGDPIWFVLPGVTFNGSSSFSGTLYRTTGPYFAALPFNPAAVVATPVGSATITFPPKAASALRSKAASELCFGLSAAFIPTVQGVTRTMSACVQAFGTNPTRAPQPTGAFNPRTCRGSGSIRLTGILDIPNCPASVDSVHTTAVLIEGIDWTQTGTQEGFVEIEKGQWICDFPTHNPQPMRRFWLLNIPMQRDGAGTIVGAASITENQQGRSYTGNIDFRVPGGINVSGNFDARETYPLWGMDYRWTGTFSCIPDR